MTEHISEEELRELERYFHDHTEGTMRWGNLAEMHRVKVASWTVSSESIPRLIAEIRRLRKEANGQQQSEG